MNEFIFQKSNDKDINEQIKKYCIVDKKTGDDESGYPTIDNPSKESDVLAYSVYKSNGGRKFMIRINSDRKLYNPLSIYGNEKSYQLLDNISRSSILYKEVDNTAFELYLRFLLTKNTAWLHKAEREI